MIYIDNRETDLIDEFDESEITIKQLDIGDIIIENYLIERKTISDLAASIKDGRLREQKYRMKELNKKIIYIIEGTICTDFPKLKTNGILNSTLLTTIIKMKLIENIVIINNDI